MSNLVSAEVLACSPSAQAGVDEATERRHRAWGAELVQEAGILLQLPQAVMVTGQAILQRFFYRRSLRAFSASTVAMASIFLAAKIEESMKRIRDVLCVFNHMHRKRRQLPAQPLLMGSPTYQRWAADAFLAERHILKELGFRLYAVMQHPHKFILYFVKALRLREHERDVAQHAWAFLNASMRTDCCVRYKPQAMACAGIFVAARVLRVNLPCEPPTQWWDLFETTYEEIILASARVLALRGDGKAQWLEPLDPDPRRLAAAAQTVTAAALGDTSRARSDQ